MTAYRFSRQAMRLAAPEADVWKIHYEAIERQARGEDILLLSTGDPDFDTPHHISDYMIQRCRQGRTHYSPPAGEMALRAAIANMECYATGKAFSPENVVIFPGATAALYAILATILDPGDGVVVVEPQYVGYQGIFDALDIRPRWVSLPGPDFCLAAESVLAAIDPSIKAVLINTPGNPCGNIISNTCLRALARGCQDLGLWLLCDEVYSLLAFDAPHVSLLKCVDDMDGIVVIDGLSKSHAMSGWRIGWSIATPAVTKALTRLSSAIFFGVCQFVQDGAAYAITHNLQDIERMRTAYRQRRDYVCARIQAMPGLDSFRPKAGMFVMIDTRAVAQSGAEFAQTLLNEAGISTIPGGAFGPGTSHYVRMSLTQDLDHLKEACDRIARLLAGPGSGDSTASVRSPPAGIGAGPNTPDAPS